LNPGLSPDGRWLAVDRDEGKNRDIWLRDLKRGVSSRLTTDPRAEFAPLFTPDGKSVVFSRDEGKDGWSLVELSLDSSAERVLVPPASTELAVAISPDGRTILYGRRRVANGGPQFDLYATDLTTGGEGKPYAATDFNEFGGSFSPDGKWLAYYSNESGRNEVYVQSFPVPARKWQVSTQGGSQPIWSHDGATLYYRGPGNKMMQVAVKTSPGFDAGIPQEMYVLPVASVTARSHLVLAPDGERLLVIAASGDVVSTPTTVVLHWNAALRR